MKSIDVADAGREFPELIEKVGQGEEFLIVKDGQPVAKLVPQSAGEKAGSSQSRGFKNKMDDSKWAAAYRRMVEHLDEGADLGGLKIDREELYDRALGIDREKPREADGKSTS